MDDGRDGRTVLKSYRLPEELVARLEALAKREDRSPTKQLKVLLERALAEEPAAA